MRRALRGRVLLTVLMAAFAGLTGCGVAFDNVFMGDSITYFWSVPGKNLGVPGDTTAEMLLRFPYEVPEHGFKTFVILGGTNDIRYDIPIEDALGNIATMAKASRQAGMAVVLCELSPNYQDKFTHDPDIRALNKLIVELAASENYYLVDYYDPMVGHPEYFKDGLHPNAEGYAVMDRALIPVLASVRGE